MMVGRQRLELFCGVLVVARVLGATASAAAVIEERLVAVRRADSAHDHSSYNKVSNTAVNDNLAPQSIRSLPVPLMERRALLTVTDEGRGSVGGVGGIRTQRKRGQRHLRSDVSSNTSGARGNEESFSTSSVRHPPCDEIEISESYLSASETTRSSYPPENVIDGDLDTHWATEGLGSWLMIDFPETTALQGVEVAFMGNSDGSRDDSQSFTMLVLGDNQVIHRPDVNVGATRGLQYLGFERQILTRSVVLVGYGREGHTSLAEVKLCGAQVRALSKSHEELADDDLHQRTNRRATRNLRGSRRHRA